jgi:hypothetical protein
LELNALKISRPKYLIALAGYEDIFMATTLDIEDNKESDNKPANKAVSITKSNRQKNFTSDAFTEDERRLSYDNLENTICKEVRIKEGKI